MKQYLDIVKHVLENGEFRSDRTGVGTISMFGLRAEYDLRKGFPLVTTKRVNFSAVVKELLWFLSGSIKVADLDCSIWDEWKLPNGTIGPGYGASWRAIYHPTQELVLVDRRLDAYADFAYPYETQRFAPIECDLNTEDCWAFEDLGSDSGNRRYRIQHASGFIAEIARPNWRNLKDRSQIDGYARTIHGVGFRGHAIAQEDGERLCSLWHNMMARCYNTAHPSYPYYGGAGVTVSPIWHSYEYFCKTISRVPGYHVWVDTEMNLDKDYYGSKVYSPTTCIFLDPASNAAIRSDGTMLDINGAQCTSYAEWARDKRRGSYAKSRWDQGLLYKGIAAADVKTITPPEGKLWRRKVVHDQLSEVIRQIKETPDSRRMIVDSWNVPMLHKMALPPCHLLYQFYVTSDGHLDCQLYQRSADLALGVPFNIASYALLTHMIANECGLTPGRFVHVIGDAHVYANHVDGLREQLSRQPRKLPTVKLANKPVLEMTYDDITLCDYEPDAPIKFKVAV